jgi:hypothetical protein
VVAALTSAPASSSGATSPSCPCCAAACSGVSPAALLAHAPTPAAASAATRLALPPTAAACITYGDAKGANREIIVGHDATGKGP